MTNSRAVNCPLSDCFYPDVGCHLGHVNPELCEHITLESDSSSDENQNELDSPFPWTGRAFGLNDLRFISGRRKPLTIGLIGPENAGKTTLLAMLFLMISRGVNVLENELFAGSFTLEGWDNIASWLQLNPSSPIQFPPHTTSQRGREPGLLHLALSSSDRSIRDVILTDAPGEWFSAWTQDATAVNAEGARWVAEHSDRFLLIADTEALTGNRSGPSRNTLNFLASRLSSEADNRPVALVWTKTDLPRSKNLVESVEGHFHRRFPNAPTFCVKVPPEPADGGLGFIEDLRAVYAWALDEPVRSGSIIALNDSKQQDAFLAYERWRDG